METSQLVEDSRQVGVIDDTIILVGLLLMQETLFKSGYSADVMVELQDRLTGLIRQYSGKGL